MPRTTRSGTASWLVEAVEEAAASILWLVEGELEDIATMVPTILLLQFRTMRSLSVPAAQRARQTTARLAAIQFSPLLHRPEAYLVVVVSTASERTTEATAAVVVEAAVMGSRVTLGERGLLAKVTTVVRQAIPHQPTVAEAVVAPRRRASTVQRIMEAMVELELRPRLQAALLRWQAAAGVGRMLLELPGLAGLAVAGEETRMVREQPAPRIPVGVAVEAAGKWATTVVQAAPAS